MCVAQIGAVRSTNVYAIELIMFFTHRRAVHRSREDEGPVLMIRWSGNASTVGAPYHGSVVFFN